MFVKPKRFICVLKFANVWFGGSARVCFGEAAHVFSKVASVIVELIDYRFNRGDLQLFRIKLRYVV